MRISIFILALTLIFTSCKDEEKKNIKPVVIEFKKEAELTLYKSTTDSIIKTIDIEIADTDYDIQTGLMYRDSMKDNQGMLFMFPDMQQRFFYMKNTKFPLDVIYLDNNNTIVSFQENAKPLDETSLPSTVPAQYVLEINGGLAEKWLLEIGDRMEFIKTNE